MLSCKDINHLASDHIDNNLPFFKKIQFKLHLFMCHNCRNFIKQFKITVETLKKVNLPVETPENVEVQVQNLLKVNQHVKSSTVDT